MPLGSLPSVPRLVEQGAAGEPVPLFAGEGSTDGELAPPIRTLVPETADDAARAEPRPGRSGGSGFGGMMGAGGGGRSPFGYGTMWQPGRAVDGQSTDLALWQHRLDAGAPLWRDGPDMVLVTAGVTADLFQTSAILPDSQRPFPDELWNIRLGTRYFHRFDSGWTAGAGLNVGSGSDRPFHQLRDYNVSVLAFLTIPHGERNAWNFALFYSPMSEIPFPIPGVSYLWEPSDQFRINLGIPAQVTYRPREDLTLDFSYMLLRTIHAQATYHLTDEWRIYAAFDWENQSWFLSDRVDDRERLWSYDKRLTLGVQADLIPHVRIDAYGGYLLDRFYFTGRKYADNGHDRIDIANGPFLALQLGLRW